MQYADGQPVDFDDDEYDYQPTDNHSISEPSLSRHHRSSEHSHKTLEPGCHRLKLMINYRPVYVNVYSTSMIPGMVIRDAITGTRYREYKTGSNREHQFFKAVVSIGQVSEGRPQSREPICLFFDSPEQFERHMSSSVSPETKSSWAEKRCYYIEQEPSSSSGNVQVK